MTSTLCKDLPPPDVVISKLAIAGSLHLNEKMESRCGAFFRSLLFVATLIDPTAFEQRFSQAAQAARHSERNCFSAGSSPVCPHAAAPAATTNNSETTHGPVFIANAPVSSRAAAIHGSIL